MRRQHGHNQTKMFPIMRWLRRSRERDDRHLIKGATPLPEIDPIEELGRIVGDAQEQDVKDERRFEDMARLVDARRSHRRPRPR
jgi:hypothetical protein